MMQLVLLNQQDSQQLLRKNQSLNNRSFGNSLRSITPGEHLSAPVVFTSCPTNPQGRCWLIVKYRVFKPDGSLYGDLKPLPGWLPQQPPPTGNQARLVHQFINLKFKPGDPRGTYRIEAILADRISGKTLNLSREIKLKDKKKKKKRFSLFD